ncbi:MAG: endonuclease III domain-containing protein [Candidatus Woesearchaeota archaeon]
MNRKEYFLEIFKKAEKKYGAYDKRLAGEGWEQDWMTLVATILSAQTRDETTIPVAEGLFKNYPKVEMLAKAKLVDVEKAIRKINFYKNKSKHIIGAAKWLIDNGYTDGTVPDNIEELIKMPGVGRKTANLILSECHNKDSITCDTHVFAICNLLGFTKAKNPTQTEQQLKEYIPRQYWSRINRLFVLWGKDVPRKTKEKLLAKLNEK